MWPVAHAEFTQRVLDLILSEGRSKGTNFRKQLLSEHNLGLRPHNTRYVYQWVGHGAWSVCGATVSATDNEYCACVIIALM